MTGAYIIFGIIALASYAVSMTLQSKFKKYSGVALGSGMSGKDVAERMLRENGIYDVSVVSVSGHLTDHYNPLNKTVNLSQSVYSSRSVAAAAVAAHECGHAVQHAKAYPWLTMRSNLVPLVSVSSKYLSWILLAGILTVNIFPALMLAGIILFSLTTLFSFITLPVEINASQRAIAWLEQRQIVDARTESAAKDALKWAALTYVVAALGSLATLIYYILIFLNSQRRN
ncbi:MAG: zinc metallopeptidase [Prevotellaceae bacterium]|jgi:Zn-dependent membrane protease YugP|nr:zinc metallopeptidase [Prevotellaceae bacterium]